MTTDNSHCFGLPKRVIDQLLAIFRHAKTIERVILYGSRAMGTFRQGSDIDLCIEADHMNLSQLLKIENEIDELLLPWKVDLSMKHQIDNPNLLQHINEAGIVFYSPK